MTAPARAELLAGIASCLEAARRPVLVGIDGGDGVGKTWFADELAGVLSERGTPTVRAGVDDFHHERAHRHARGRTPETVWERSFDYRALRRELLDPWLRGAGSFRRRWHDLATDVHLDEEPEEVPGAGVLVVDGVFLQRPELRDAWDVTVWLEAPDEVRVARLVERDGGPPDPGHPDHRRYREAQRRYRERYDPADSADIVVDNTDLDRPSRGERGQGPCPTCGRP